MLSVCKTIMRLWLGHVALRCRPPQRRRQPKCCIFTPNLCCLLSHCAGLSSPPPTHPHTHCGSANPAETSSPRSAVLAVGAVSCTTLCSIMWRQLAWLLMSRGMLSSLLYLHLHHCHHFKEISGAQLSMVASQRSASANMLGPHGLPDQHCQCQFSYFIFLPGSSLSCLILSLFHPL